jgi:hypothetical protein
MTTKDQLKLLNAGFTIIRPEVSHIAMNKVITRKIKAKTTCRHEWHTLETGFITDVIFKKRIAKLLESPTVVQD